MPFVPAPWSVVYADASLSMALKVLYISTKIWQRDNKGTQLPGFALSTVRKMHMISNSALAVSVSLTLKQ